MSRAVGLAAYERRNDLIDAMLASIAAFVDFFARHPDYLRVVLREEQSSWGVDPACKSRKQVAMWREGIAGAVMAMQQGIAEGTLVDDDPEAMARAFLALQQAHLGYWSEKGRRASTEELTGVMQRQFLRAFCRPEVLAARLALLQRPRADRENAPESRRSPAPTTED